MASTTTSTTEGPRSKRKVILDAAVTNFGSVGYEHTKWATESVADACVRLVP